MAQKILSFLTRDIWRIRAKTLPRPRAIGLRTLRIILVSVKEFSRDNCALRASALTFFSLLSIVPVLAMAFGMAKGFGLDKTLRMKLLENVGNQEEVLIRVIDFAENMLANAKGGVIAGIGLAFLFWTVIKVFANIESSFNHIWGVRRERSWGRKFSDYLSLMLICPIVFVMASSASVFITTQVTDITARIELLGYAQPLILFMLKFLPLSIFWGLLTFIYVFMPNTRVQFSSALLGGITAGTVYQLTQWVYIHFQVGVSKAGAIYGSFAALPLFLMWLQISWLIVLFGAELAFAHQNEATFEFEQDCMEASGRLRKLLALRMTHLVVDRFCRGLDPCTAEEIAAALETPIRLSRELLNELADAGVLTVAGEQERQRRFLPARDPDDISVNFVLDRLDRAGSDQVPIADSDELKEIRRVLEESCAVLDHSAGSVRLKDIGSFPGKQTVEAPLAANP